MQEVDPDFNQIDNELQKIKDTTYELFDNLPIKLINSVMKNVTKDNFKKFIFFITK